MDVNRIYIFMHALDILSTRGVFPKIYDGFREMDELAKGEDDLLKLLKACVKAACQDKLLTTMGLDKTRGWEDGLGLGHDGTPDERRDAVIAQIQRNRIINDASILALARYASGEAQIQVDTDCTALTMDIHMPENSSSEREAEAVKEAKKALMPAAPQNLAISSSVIAEREQNLTASLGWHTALIGKCADASMPTREFIPFVPTLESFNGTSEP